MKICPICKARCFEDMEICYGCMYHFETIEASVANTSELENHSTFTIVQDSLPSGSQYGIKNAELNENVEEASIEVLNNEGNDSLNRYCVPISLGADRGFATEYRLTISIEPRTDQDTAQMLGS